MIIYLNNPEINKDQWDSCIEASGSYKPYACSWYLDIMAPEWEAMVDDDYDAVFPLPGKKRFGIRYLATPVFLQQLGVFSPDKSLSDSIHDFIDYMPEFYKLIDLCVNQKIARKSFKVTTRSNFELDLSLKYESLWSGFTADCRRDIHVGEKKNHEISRKVTPEEIINLFVSNKGKVVNGIKPEDYSRLSELMKYCLSTGKGEILGVRGPGKKLIYAVFLVIMPRSKTTLFIANTDESREKRTGYYVINEIIKDNAGTRTVLDFAGSTIPGVAHFVKSFGSINNPYYRIYRNSLPLPLKLFR